MSTPERTEPEAQGDEKKELRAAWNRLMNSEDGRKCLADLQRRYGWKDGVELPSYQANMPPNDFIHRDGMKDVVRYILRQISRPDGHTETPKD